MQPRDIVKSFHYSLYSGLCNKHNYGSFQCNAGVATYKMFEQLNRPPTKLMLLGCGCSTESEATAQVSHLFNVTQVKAKLQAESIGQFKVNFVT